MIAPAQTETIAAARTLVQWARTYQARWRPDATASSLAACDPVGSDYVPVDSAERGRPDDPDASDGSDFLDGLGTRYSTLESHLDPVENDFGPPVATPPKFTDAGRKDFEEPDLVEPPMPQPAAAPPEPAPPVPAPHQAAPPPDPVPAVAIQPPAPAPVAPNAAVSPKAKRRSVWVWAGAGAAAAVVMLAVAAPFLLKPKVAPAPPEPTTGLMSLESIPDGATAFIDGVEAGQTPLVKEVPVGSHVVEFRRGKNARTLQLAVVGGTKVTGLMDWNKKPTGRLVVKSSASDTAVLVDRKKRGTAPLTLDDLPVGKHTVTLQSSLGSVSRTVTIAEGKTVTVSEDLAPGLLKVTAPARVKVFEGSDVIPLNDKRQALLPSGTHTLRFVDDVTGASERRTVTIEPNEITEVSVAPNVAASAPETPSPAEAVTGERP